MSDNPVEDNDPESKDLLSYLAALGAIREESTQQAGARIRARFTSLAAWTCWSC